jgi:hypothetical protein
MFKITKYNKAPVVITAGVLFLLSTMSNLSAQETFIQNDLQHKINLYNVNGKPFLNSYVDVAGTPFFLVAWKYGKIKINDSTVFTNIQLRLNLQNQEVHFRKPDNSELVIEPGAVKQITLLDSTGKIPVSYTFQCGFPAIDNQNAKNFYQILCSGKIKLLMASRKSIYESKDVFSGEVRKEFREYDDYYFFFQDKLQRIKKEKTYVLSFMKDKNAEMEKFIDTNRISFRSSDDIKKLVDYYNSFF